MYENSNLTSICECLLNQLLCAAHLVDSGDLDFISCGRNGSEGLLGTKHAVVGFLSAAEQGHSSLPGIQHPAPHCCSDSVSQCPVSVTERGNPERCKQQHLGKLLCLVAFFSNPASSNFCVFLLQPLKPL